MGPETNTNNKQNLQNQNEFIWGDSYQRDLPPFLPDQQNSEKPPVSEKAVAEKMLEISSDRQDDLVDWMNQIHKGQGLTSEAYAEFDRFREQNHLPNLTEEEWASDLESQLAHQETQDGYLIDAMEDLDSPNNTRSLEEILASRAAKVQEHIDTLAQSGAWEKMTDAQRDALVSRRDSYENLSSWAPHVRNILLSDSPESASDNILPLEKSEVEQSEIEQSEAEQSQPTTESSPEKILNTNSEAEIRAILESLDHIQPDIRQLFAISRGSFSMEQATAHLLTSNQQMLESSATYLSVLQNGQSVGEVQQFANAYDTQSAEKCAQSLNSINAIRQKAATLPISLKGQIVHYCQNVENALGQILSTIKSKDGKIHNTPVEKQKADEKETEELLKEGSR